MCARLSLPCLFGLLLVSQTAMGESGDRVRLVRLPKGAIQPQVAVGDDGTAHLVYFRGAPANGDLFYARLAPDADSIGNALPINQELESAIAIGNIRGAHVALGRKDRVHVAWMGSGKAQPRGPDGATPMLYTRTNDSGTAFETERNVIDGHVGLDGGGSLAADREGNVYVVWHAPKLGQKGEVNRRVWSARSDDDGRTFEPEQLAFDQPIGCCGCCGMRAFADRDGGLFVLYRSAEEAVHRDMWLLASHDHGRSFSGSLTDRWLADVCVMSTSALTDATDGVLAAWETQGQVYFGRVDPQSDKVARVVAAPGATGGRKHPTLAVNAEGEIILAWTEGMGWERGGSVAWQVYDSNGKPIEGAAGRADGVPVWSLVAVFAWPDGRFTLLY